MRKFNDIYNDFQQKQLFEEYEQIGFGSIDESGAGLSRVLKRMEDGNKFIMITASRNKYSKKENHRRNNELLRAYRDEFGKKVGAYKLIGHWKECSSPLKDNEKIGDCKGKIVNSLEETWMINVEDLKVMEKFSQKMAEKYNQDAYIVLNGKDIKLKGKDGSVWETWKKPGYDSLSSGFAKIVDLQGYSELGKNRKHGNKQNIVFENLQIVIPKDNNASKMLFEKMGILK